MAALEELLEISANLRERNALIEAEGALRRCYDLAPDDPVVSKELFTLYQHNIDALKKSPYMDYPLFVSLETQTLCNAKCTFCPYPALDRLGTKMPDALIDKILDDLKDIPSNVPFRLAPFKVSDPFTEPRLFPIILKINRELPNAVIDIYTNGAALTPAKLQQLIQTKNLEYLNISLNDHRSDVYESIMGLKFERTLARLDMLHQVASESQLPFTVVVSRVCDYKTDEDFRSWVNQRYPLFHVQTHRRSDWIGQVDVEGHLVPNIGCAQWFGLSIMSTGVVAYCCMDGAGEHPIGDVSKEHALAIYNAHAYRNVRANYATRIGGIPCGQCTFF